MTARTFSGPRPERQETRPRSNQSRRKAPGPARLKPARRISDAMNRVNMAVTNSQSMTSGLSFGLRLIPLSLDPIELFDRQQQARSSRPSGVISRCRRSSPVSNSAIVSDSSNIGASATIRPSGPVTELPPPETKAVLETDAVDNDDNRAHQLRVGLRKMSVGIGSADPWSLNASGRRIRGANQHIDFLGLHDGGRRQVPEVLTNENAHPTEASRFERLESLSCGEVTLLLEKPVRRQVSLSMNVNDLAPFGIKRGVVKAVAGRFLDEAQHHRHIAGRVEQLPNLGRLGRSATSGTMSRIK